MLAALRHTRRMVSSDGSPEALQAMAANLKRNARLVLLSLSDERTHKRFSGFKHSDQQYKSIAKDRARWIAKAENHG